MLCVICMLCQHTDYHPNYFGQICYTVVAGALMEQYHLTGFYFHCQKPQENCWDIKALSSLSSGSQTWMSVLDPWAINESTSLNLASGDYFKSRGIFLEQQKVRWWSHLLALYILLDLLSMVSDRGLQGCNVLGCS